MNFAIDFESNLTAEDKNIIYGGLLAHNVEEIGLPLEVIRTKRFAFIVRENSHIKAGLVGTTKYAAAFIDILWVDKSLRKRGLGRQLLKRAEEYARSNACSVIFLNTLTPANVNFYEKSGYIFEFARANYLGDFKQTMRYFRKKL